MDDALTGKVVGGCYLRHAGWLLSSLFFHDTSTFSPQLHTRIGMDGVVDAVVSRHPAAQHLTVGCVHDGVNSQRCDVAAPQKNALVQRAGFCGANRRYFRLGNQALKEFILQVEPGGLCWPRWARIHQGAKRRPQLIGVGGDRRLDATLITQLSHGLTKQVHFAFCVHVTAPFLLRSTGRP